MAIVATQIREANGTFRETFEDGPAGFTGVREYLLSGAPTLEAAVTGPISGLPNRGDPWSNDYPSCIALTRNASWISVNRVGEALGRIKVSVPYGPPSSTVINDNAAAQHPGQTWTEYGTGSISQAEMFGFTPGTNNRYPIPIDNGRGINLDIGILVLKVSHVYGPADVIPIANFLNLMRPPKVNLAAVTVPSIFGRNNALNFAPGQLLYKGHTIEGKNSLTVVTHEVWGSSDWQYTWVSEDEDGAPLSRDYVDVYGKADFTGLW